MNSYIHASDFFKTISPDDRVFLLVRHGERRHITPQDADAGAHVGLTDKGREQALALGRCFPSEGDAVYFSSPVGRCIETAQKIGLGRESAGGPKASEVQILNPLGDFFVKDFEEYRAVLNEKFYPSICEWLACGEHPAYHSLAPRSEEMLKMILEKMAECQRVSDPATGLGSKPRFGIFCSHDAWIVPCLAYFCKFSFTPGVWMNFLSGLAFVVSAKENLSAGGNVKDCVKRIVPITGLDDGNLIF